MKTAASLFGILLVLVIAPVAVAQASPANTGQAQMPEPGAATAAVDVAAGAQAAVAVVDTFGKALAAADFEQVEAMLDPAVIILESGGAERSRSEYLVHHAKSDAAFLAGSHSALSQRTARIDGDTVWVASESEVHASKDGKPMTVLSTETMVLKKSSGGWKIVHIHWSSRPKQ